TGIEEPGDRGRLKPGSVNCQKYNGGTLKECASAHGIRPLLADAVAPGKKFFRGQATRRTWTPPPSWKPTAPSPCEARAGRGLGRGAPSIGLAANWNPLSLTL